MSVAEKHRQLSDPYHQGMKQHIVVELSGTNKWNTVVALRNLAKYMTPVIKDCSRKGKVFDGTRKVSLSDSHHQKLKQKD